VRGLEHPQGREILFHRRDEPGREVFDGLTVLRGALDDVVVTAFMRMWPTWQKS
jgi:hypothetical protein